MRLRLLLPLLWLFVIPVAGQEEKHAPTPTQCRADADLWGIPKNKGLIYTTTETKGMKFLAASLEGFKLSFEIEESARTLKARIAELDQCTLIDNKSAERYHAAERAYVINVATRLAEFVRGHNLMEQFYEEDEQGKH